MRTFLCIVLFVLVGLRVYAQPANDLCTGATTIVPDGTCYSGTTNSANDNISGEVGCATQSGPNGHRDVWFSFTATMTTVQFNITSPSGSTIELLLISGSCATPVLENSTCQTSPLATTFAGLTVGQVYYYVISFPANVGSSFSSCVTSIAAPPESGQNCTAAVPICSNSSFGGNSDGYGVQELNSSNRGCLSSNERQSSWYYFQVQTSGSLDMTIDPSSNTDYDFAMWGPMAAYSCPVIGPPVRCSYASQLTTYFQTGSYNTGFGPSGTEASDGSGGTLNGWASTLNVIAGEFYILLIDNYLIDKTPFTLSWGGTSVLSCALLPVELSEFSGRPFEDHNMISWTTLSESENKKFTLERSEDGRYFQEIYSVQGYGNTNSIKYYHFRDFKFFRGKTNYYRLKQEDHNGEISLSQLIAVNNESEKTIRNIIIVDMLGKEQVQENLEPGIYVFITEYEDGSFSTEKKWMP